LNVAAPSGKIMTTDLTRYEVSDIEANGVQAIGTFAGTPRKARMMNGVDFVGYAGYEQLVIRVPEGVDVKREISHRSSATPADLAHHGTSQDVERAAGVQQEHALSSRDLCAQYPRRGSMPARVVEQLYATRDVELARLGGLNMIEPPDLVPLDRGARFIVACSLFERCSIAAQDALLCDEHHSVRSAAFLAVAGADLPPPAP
jgi:hypothetical protein